MTPSPLDVIASWLDEARAAGLPEPEAMTLATATPTGAPSARIVLCRGISPAGVRFFTNYESRKGDEIAANPVAALLFYWAPLNRQARVEGRIERLPADESDAYFHARPRGSQLSALVSPQSRTIASLEALRARQQDLARQYEGREIPRPPHWGGYRVAADVVELWRAGADRLHERRLFRRIGDAWSEELLGP